MGKNSFYLGEVGNASKMNLVLQVQYYIINISVSTPYIADHGGSDLGRAGRRYGTGR